MAEGTNLSISLKIDDLVDGLDKAAAKFEGFAERANEAMALVDSHTGEMSEVQKRAYEVIKKSYDNHSKALQELGKEYEALREKSKSGAEMTQSECARLQALTSEFKKHSGTVYTAVTEMGRLAKEQSSFIDKALKNENVFKSIMGAVSGVAAIVAAKFTGFIIDCAASIGELGLQTQQIVSQLGAMGSNLAGGAAAYQAFNDVARNTNYDFSAVYEMGRQLLNMGYSAKNAADLIQLCSDTAAGLGQDVSGAQQLVTTIARIQSTGRVTQEQLASLQMAGLDLDEAFAPLGMSAAAAMKQLQSGTLDGQDTIKALTDYMHQFDGKMAESKNNLTDMWGDVSGNIATACGEIGAGIADAFSKSEIVQGLINFTQSLIDLVRGEGSGAFSDLGAAAQGALALIGDALEIVYSVIKLGIIWVNELYAAFKEMCCKVYDYLSFILEPLGQIFSTVGKIIAAVGGEIKAGIDESFSQTFKPKVEIADTGNNFKQRAAVSGTGSASAAAAGKLSEEERAVDALIKKYADASAQAKTRGDLALKTAALNASMLSGEAQSTAELENKLAGLAASHESIIAGYQKELELAGQIGDAGTRQNAIDEINRQIEAQNLLYEAQVKAANFNALQADSRDIVDKAFGDPESVQEKIESYKTMLTNFMSEVNSIEAGGSGSFTADAMEQDMSAESMGFLTKLLKMSPEQLAEEFATKQEQFATFAEFIQNKMAEATAAEAENLSVGEKWKEKQQQWIGEIGKSMGSAVTEWLTGSKSIGEAMREMVADLLKEALRLFLQWQAVYYALIAFKNKPEEAAEATNKMVLGMAGGGYVRGAGTAVSDSIPAMLSNGEYVINAEAVRSIGVGTLDAINGGYLPELKTAEISQAGGSVNAAFNMYGDVNNAAGLDDMWGDFNEMLAAGLRGAG